MKRISLPFLGLTGLFVVSSLANLFASAGDPLLPPTKKVDWFTKAVKKVEAVIEPAELKPGQVGTYRVTFTLNDDAYTYPLKQPEKQAANDTNRISWPTTSQIVFVDEASASPNFKTRPEPALQIQEFRYYENSVSYERKFVVNPAADPAADVSVAPEVQFSACWKSVCYPPKSIKPEAKFKILPGPAIEVPAEYVGEVKRAFEK